MAINPTAFFTGADRNEAIKSWSIPIILLLALPLNVWSQCPSVRIDSIRWEMEPSGSGERSAIIQGVRKGFVRYCEIADLLDPAAGYYGEEKGAEFLQSFHGAVKVFNDLDPKSGEEIRPEEYHDKVYQGLFSTGVKYKLSQASISSVRASEPYLVATVHFTKQMFNGVDANNRYIDYTGKRPVMLDLELEIILKPRGAGVWEPAFGSIRNRRQRQKRTWTNSVELYLGGRYDMATAVELTSPWQGTSPIGTSMPSAVAELGYRIALDKDGQWNALVGAGFRQGQIAGKLKEDLQGSLSTEGRQIGSQYFSVPFHRQWTIRQGTRLGIDTRTVYVPLGIRYIPTPSIYREWSFDAQLLGGYSFLNQFIEGGMDLAHGYEGEMDCTASLDISRETGSDTQDFPFAEARLSAGYQKAWLSRSTNRRIIGWFVRADLGMGILPLFNTSSNTPWASLQDDGSVSFGTESFPLFRSMQTANVGIRAGIFWKLTR